MSKSIIRLALSAMLLILCTPAEAQQPGKMPRIGFLSPFSAAPDPRVEAFRQGLRELGYVEGQNVTIEYRWADGRFERLPDLAADLVRLKVDVIVAVVTQASLAAQKATGAIPIVMVGVSDPVGSELVASLARPGANITGTSSMKEVVPKVSRFAFLDAAASGPGVTRSMLPDAQAAAQALGLSFN